MNQRCTLTYSVRSEQVLVFLRVNSVQSNSGFMIMMTMNQLVTYSLSHYDEQQMMFAKWKNKIALLSLWKMNETILLRSYPFDVHDIAVRRRYQV